MKRRIHLPLYGTIDYPSPECDLDWDLFQTAPFARLRDISLSSTPPQFQPLGQATTRFEHSVAVGYLARELAARQPALAERRNTLVAACLCHDVGSPPFSHISEIFLYDLTGRTHEQMTERLLAPGSELAEALSSYGVNPAEVVDMITGRGGPLGTLVAGSIDLDNVSNTIDLLASLGYHDQLPYQPLRLLDAFGYDGEEVWLKVELLPELLGWARARKMLYALLFSEPNLSAGTMLYRSLEYAYAAGALDEGFFSLREGEALQHLRSLGGVSGELIGQVERWRHFPRLCEIILPQEDARLVGLYDNWKARKAFTDELADRLGIPREQLTFYVGRDRADKPIRLPFRGPGATAAAQLLGGGDAKQRVAVFAHKRWAYLRDTGRVISAVEQTAAQLEPAAADHAFF